MKPLHEQEVIFLEGIEELWQFYQTLPKLDLGISGGNEYEEMKKRFDDIKYMVAIRGMLRDGIREENKELPEPLKLLND